MTWVCIKDDACKAFDSSSSTFNNFSKQKRAYTPYFLVSCIVSMGLETKLIILRSRVWIQCNTVGLTIKVPVFFHFGVPWTYGRQ